MTPGADSAPGVVVSLASHIAAKAGPPVRVRLSARADGLQRRSFFRVDALLVVHATVVEPGTPAAPEAAALTTTANVSGGGLLLQDPLGLPLGTVLDLDLELAPNEPPVWARGRVVREVPPHHRGVLIYAIAGSDRERLVQFVTARQREDLARKVHVR